MGSFLLRKIRLSTVCVFVRSAHFSTEVAYRIALLLFHFASPLSRRLHQKMRMVGSWISVVGVSSLEVGIPFFKG